MVHIKNLVLRGFKSFPKETKIDFDKAMNIIVGPNGSGKSNLVDALCFVLGRMRIKSLRAAKSANLIFTGTKQYRPATEASVKLILDNSDKKFSIDGEEVIVERIVRNTGQSLYRINNKTRTRQEVLELLAQAGIDPYGFNIVLQGEINGIIRMHPEERRKIIEEVAGISIYELRKEKSLKELNKTEEKLREIETTLRARASYLKNLEEERNQAMKYKKLEKAIKIYKASILKRKLNEKIKEISIFNNNKEKKDKEKEKIRKKEQEIMRNIETLEREIGKINSLIQKSSGIEQDQLNKEISDLRADLAGLSVRKENIEERIANISSRRETSDEEITNLKNELDRLRKQTPEKTKYLELEKKKLELSNLEKEKKTFYNLKEKLNSIKERLKDKETSVQKNKNEEIFILKEINKISGLRYTDKKICGKKIIEFRKELKDTEYKLENFDKERREREKLISFLSSEISRHENIKKQVGKLDICPLCKTKITKEHVKQLFNECDKKISLFNAQLKENKKIIEKSDNDLKELKMRSKTLQERISEAEINLIKLENLNEKKEIIKKLAEEQKNLQEELFTLQKERKNIDKKISQFKNVEERYDKTLLEIQEISSRTEKTIDTELELKERQLENLKIEIKQSQREEEELRKELIEAEKEIQEKQDLLSNREKEAQTLENKYQKLLEKRNFSQKQINEKNSSLLEQRNKLSVIENEINNLKVEIARLNAEKGNLETDFQPYKTIKLINLPVYALEEKLRTKEIEFQSIGPINLRALEVYDEIKKEYDAVAEKIFVLEKEKAEILKIIEEIDNKKRRTFMKTLKAINELFNRNFMQLSTKGEVFLEPENREDIFSAGLDIVIKVGKGKYFDITSLSGGEQTLVALSLIFAIQEYKPYCFYILDEVDAALDKRNSERLASLVKKYMKTGQYIVITHNDAIISEAGVLYGVSMQEGISKILSLEF